LSTFQTLLEAQELAVKEHSVEFKSNLWVSHSDAKIATRVKGLRKHKASLFGRVEYMFSHYYVRLEEGNPPENYYKVKFQSFDVRAADYIQKLRDRKVLFSL
jgi:large subunit ribosomal protein L22